MKEYIDQMNNTIRLESTPRRIVSLVPSQTQLLHYLDLEDSVVGITKFCIHPNEWFKTKQRVGGTKTVDIQKVQELQPDLIIGNKEENSLEDIRALSEIAPVWMSDIYTLQDALTMIQSIASITGRSSAGEELCTTIASSFEELRLNSIQPQSQKVLYFIWDDPSMLAGKQTFIDDMLSFCGLENAVDEIRYPMATGDENPDLVFLSSEPFPFKDEHITKFKEKYPHSKVVLVDGEAFSWYGSKLKEAPSYFAKLLQELSINQ